MKKTSINKYHFSKNYLLQHVWLNPENPEKPTMLPGYVFNTSGVSDDVVLCLRSLSNISEVDVKKVCEIFDVEYTNQVGSEAHFDLDGATEWIEALFSEPAGYFIDGYTGNQLLSGADYLRSKAYLLSYGEISASEILEFGWAIILEDK